MLTVTRTFGRTQFEAWLSMQQASIRGLESAPVSARRIAVQCMKGAPNSLADALVEEWGDVTVEIAQQKLAGSDVAVTNQSDKEILLPKLIEMDEKVRTNFQASA